MCNTNKDVVPVRIDYIDAWRFLAVVMVIQSHIFVYSGLKITLLAPYLDPLDRLGELGVLIFFVISGFVICSGLVAEKSRTGTICLSAFYVRRFYRIIPPLWLYLSSLLMLRMAGIIEISPQQALTSASFLCNMPFPEGCSWFAGHTWTLAYEEQFYLIFPLLMLFVPLINNSLRFGLAIGGLIVGSVLLSRAGHLFFGEYLMYFIFLLTGCCCALLPENIISRIRQMHIAVWLIVIALLLVGIGYLPDGIEKQVKVVCYPVLILLMVLGTPTQVKSIAAVFKNRGLCYLGRISYTVYLWQELVTGNYVGWLTFVYIAAVFAFAMISYRYIELPLQRTATLMSDDLKAAAVAASLTEYKQDQQC
ncbi:MAG: acyltransferase [Methylobacter sp.]|nr:acyltransferase [Methylobacter sp.]